MLLKTALRIIVHEKEKFAGAVAGVAIAVFLMVLQWGFYQGFNRDITIVLDSIDADIWIVPKNQPTFDGWVGVDDLPYWELLEHPGVERAGRLVWGWAACRLPKTGGIDSVEVLGVEFESGIDLRFDLEKSNLAALLRPDGHVLVSDKDRDKLGIDAPGVEGMEIFGRMATPVGFVPDVHLFTTAAFILTDLDNARAFLRLAVVTRKLPGLQMQARRRRKARRRRVAANRGRTRRVDRRSSFTTGPPITGPREPRSAQCC